MALLYIRCKNKTIRKQYVLTMLVLLCYPNCHHRTSERNRKRKISRNTKQHKFEKESYKNSLKLSQIKCQMNRNCPMDQHKCLPFKMKGTIQNHIPFHLEFKHTLASLIPPSPQALALPITVFPLQLQNRVLHTSFI